jgi:hypothetical protein
MPMWANYIVYASLVCFVGLPGLLIVHELGHAVVALLCTGNRVIVRLGRPPALLRLALGRLELHFRPFDGSGFYQILDWQQTTPRQRAWAALGGPVSTLLVLVAGSALAVVSRPALDALYFLSAGIAFLAVLQLLLTVPPIHYPTWWGDYAGTYSDGYHVWRLWSTRSSR